MKKRIVLLSLMLAMVVTFGACGKEQAAEEVAEEAVAEVEAEVSEGATKEAKADTKDNKKDSKSDKNSEDKKSDEKKVDKDKKDESDKSKKGEKTSNADKKKTETDNQESGKKSLTGDDALEELYQNDEKYGHILNFEENNYWQYVNNNKANDYEGTPVYYDVQKEDIPGVWNNYVEHWVKFTNGTMYCSSCYHRIPVPDHDFLLGVSYTSLTPDNDAWMAWYNQTRDEYLASHGYKELCEQAEAAYAEGNMEEYNRLNTETGNILSEAERVANEVPSEVYMKETPVEDWYYTERKAYNMNPNN